MKILWVKAGGLLPLDSGGKIRSFHIASELAKTHDVTLFIFCGEEISEAQRDLEPTFRDVVIHPLGKHPLGLVVPFVSTLSGSIAELERPRRKERELSERAAGFGFAAQAHLRTERTGKPIDLDTLAKAFFS